jgi:hypothetical protein
MEVILVGIPLTDSPFLDARWVCPIKAGMAVSTAAIEAGRVEISLM